jgi:hypothetical protein
MSLNELFLAGNISEIWGFLESSAPDLGKYQNKLGQENKNSRNPKSFEIFRARKSLSVTFRKPGWRQGFLIKTSAV